MKDERPPGPDGPGRARRNRRPGNDSATATLGRSLARILFLLSGVFLVLGAGFVLAPAPGAAFYGLDTRHPAALLYVRAVGLRDLALAGYLFGLTLAGQRRALSIILAVTLVIPAGDLLLLAASGVGRPLHYLLHGASLVCFAALALWSRAPRTP